MTKVSNSIESIKNGAEKIENKSLNDNDLYSIFEKEATLILNEIEFKKDLQGNFDVKRPNEKIFDNLPLLLKKGIESYTYSKDKEIFLYAALASLSSIMPTVSGYYMENTKVFANIYAYLLGNAAVGKGKLEDARRLILPIHLKRQENTEGVESLILPANTSSTKMIRDLEKNGGDGLFFETEGDTMANAFKSDTGDYSDTFRKGFHHEPISLSRVTDNLKIYIAQPRISAVLSSTFGQLLSLIPNAENGLFSRFLFHEVEHTEEFLFPFDRSKRAYEGVFDELGQRFLEMHETLEEQQILFSLQEHQETFFYEAFKIWKRQISEVIKDKYNSKHYDLYGTINRLGLICFRLAMILTTIRHFENDTLSAEIVCTDEDFFTAIRLAAIAKNNAVAVYTRLPKPKFYALEDGNNFLKKADDFERAMKLKNEGKSLSEIANIILGDPKKKSTIKNWIDKAESVQKNEQS